MCVNYATKSADVEGMNCDIYIERKGSIMHRSPQSWKVNDLWIMKTQSMNVSQCGRFMIYELWRLTQSMNVSPRCAVHTCTVCVCVCVCAQCFYEIKQNQALVYVCPHTTYTLQLCRRYSTFPGGLRWLNSIKSHARAHFLSLITMYANHAGLCCSLTHTHAQHTHTHTHTHTVYALCTHVRLDSMTCLQLVASGHIDL